MKLTKSFSFIVLTLVFALVSCQGPRPIVPYDSDSEDVSVPLLPNEEEYPDSYTFGPDSIAGLSLRYGMETEDEEIYVNIDSFTILDINPRVTGSLLSFIKNEMETFGFIKPTASLSAADSISGFAESNFSEEFIESEFENLKKEFFNELPVIKEYGSAFNITFNIYPVFIDTNYVTFLKSAYCYTGGAHGNSSLELETFDITTGKALNLYDIIKADRLDEVRDEVAAHMAYSYPIYENLHTVDEYIDSLNVWLGNDKDSSSDEDETITLKNFPLPTPALNLTGLVFVYEPYQLTPGSDGSPIVVIPYKELKGCLKVTPPEN